MTPELFSDEPSRPGGPIRAGVFFPSVNDLTLVARKVDQNLHSTIAIDNRGTLTHRRIHPRLIHEHQQRSISNSHEEQSTKPSPLAHLIARELIQEGVSAVTFIGVEFVPEETVNYHD